MANLTIVATFTKSGGDPATGEALGDFDFYLTQQNKSTGADTVVWDGTQNATEEMDNTGKYIRILTTADFSLYNYHASIEYTGATGMDSSWAIGSVGPGGVLFPAGAIDFTYTVTNDVTLLPIEGVEVWISTDNPAVNIVWKGDTDAFGIARDVLGNLPNLDASPPGVPYYFWRQRSGYTFDDPDEEIVS